jgi:hypothetical protein
MKNCGKLKKKWIINCKKLEEPELTFNTICGIEFMFYIKHLTIILTYDIMIVVERGVNMYFSKKEMFRITFVMTIFDIIVFGYKVKNAFKKILGGKQ